MKHKTTIIPKYTRLSRFRQLLRVYCSFLPNENLKKNHYMWIDTSVEMTSFGIELILFCHILTIIGRRNLKNA